MGGYSQEREVERGDILADVMKSALNDLNAAQQRELDAAAEQAAKAMLEVVNEKSAEKSLPAPMLALLAAGLYQAEVVRHLAAFSGLQQLGAAAQDEALAAAQKIVERTAKAYLDRLKEDPDTLKDPNTLAARVCRGG